MLLGAAAEGATPDVVPQLLDQLRVLLLDLLRELLSPEKKKMPPVQQHATMNKRNVSGRSMYRGVEICVKMC